MKVVTTDNINEIGEARITNAVIEYKYNNIVFSDINTNDVASIKTQISNVFANGLDLSSNSVLTTFTNDASNVALLVNVNNSIPGLIVDNSDNITYLNNSVLTFGSIISDILKVNTNKFNIELDPSHNNMIVTTTDNAFLDPTTATISGFLQDGYIRGSTGLVQAMNGDLIESVTTDSFGRFRLITPVADLPQFFKITFTGGTDISTGKKIVSTLQIIANRDTIANTLDRVLIVNPLQTIKAKIVENKIAAGETISNTLISDS